MSYQILARKYRPAQFDDIIAQEHVTRTLKNALTSGRLSSGYLFTGPRGTGKTTTARVLAKALNCIEGPTPTPCDKCPSCKEITTGSSLDVLEIDAASNTGVDDIRTLRENVRYLPISGKKRIYIIDEVHRLSGSAFDALLKTLEEPPPHVVFIFATTEPSKVPETIRSRTQRYDFHRISVSGLSEHLRKIATAEKLDVDDEALFILSRKADGSVRDSLSLLDQLSAFAGEKIRAQNVIEALGLLDRQFYFKYIDIIAAKDSSAGLQMIKELINSGVEISEFGAGVAEHLRNLLILQNASEPEKILESSESEMSGYRKQVDYFSSGDLLRMIKIISDMILDLKSGLESRLLLETTTLKLASMESTILFEDILAHLSSPTESPTAEMKLDSDLFGMPNTRTAPDNLSPSLPRLPARPAGEPGEPPKRQTEIKPVLPADKGLSTEDISSGTMVRTINLPMVQSSWPKFLDFLKNESQMLSSMMAMAELREVKENIITAVFHNAGGTSKQVVEKPEHLGIITSSLREYFKTNLRIKFEIDFDKSPVMPSSKPVPKVEQIDPEKILQEDEKLRALVEKIDGEIIGKQKAEE